jgi:DNA-binding Lrp family transcriptional regulator
VPKPKPSTIKLQVFKGREAKLNKAIFHILPRKGPQTIYDIHKELKNQKAFRQTRYANVNKRVRALEESEYIQKTGIKRTKAGFEAHKYELTMRAHLVSLLGSIDLEKTVMRADETLALALLGDLLSFVSKNL